MPVPALRILFRKRRLLYYEERRRISKASLGAGIGLEWCIDYGKILKRNQAFAQRDQARFCTGLRVFSPLKTLHPRKHKVDERDQEEQDRNGENLGIADITGRRNKISEREGDPKTQIAETRLLQSQHALTVGPQAEHIN